MIIMQTENKRAKLFGFNLTLIKAIAIAIFSRNLIVSQVR